MNIIKMSLTPDTARNFINIIGAVVDEFRLSISKDGWKMKAVDPANVVLVNIDLPEESFGNYEFAVTDIWTSSIDGHPTGVLKEQIDVGIDIETIRSFLGDMNDTEVMLDDELYAPVKFSFSIAERYYNRYQLELRQGMFRRDLLLLNETDIRKPPNRIVFPSDYRLLVNTLEFTRIIKKAQKVSDYIRLGFRHETGEMTFTASTKDDIDFTWEAEKQVQFWKAVSDKPRDVSSSLFSLDYLHDIMQVIPSEKVNLDLGHDLPCRLSFPLGLTGKCEYMIAPRLESE
uniref:Putative DNA polymerase n=1 Tax=viral metagenome TaxID=1070528 RepID=A0A6M3Y595_9ZZZZ